MDTSLIPARYNAKLENVEIELFQANGEKLPYIDNLFNNVLCMSSLQHVNNQYNTLNEITRVLSKKGLLIISVPQTIRKSTFKKLGIYTMHFNLDILTKLLEDCNFQILETKTNGFLPPIFRKILNYFYPILGEKITKKIIVTSNYFSHFFPKLASSIIIVAETKK